MSSHYDHKPTPPKLPQPSPGSDEALARGCTCPAIDNHHGEGVMRMDARTWFITEGCPLHCPHPLIALV